MCDIVCRGHYASNAGKRSKEEVRHDVCGVILRLRLIVGNTEMGLY